MKRKQHVLGYGQDRVWQLERVYDHVGLLRYMLKGTVDRWHRYAVSLGVERRQRPIESLAEVMAAPAEGNGSEKPRAKA